MAFLCFGGSFNPIHHGHLICARAVAERKAFSKVVLIPSAQPPHKQVSATMAAAQDRLAMCRLAVEGEPFFDVDDLELNRPGPSYTIDSAHELAQRSGERVYWLIGADMLLVLPTWRRPQDLLRDVEFVVMARPGWSIDWNTLPSEMRKLEANVVEAPRIDISATEIRRRVREGLSIAYLTPPQVARYIRERALYS